MLLIDSSGVEQSGLLAFCKAASSRNYDQSNGTDILKRNDCLDET